MGINKDYVLGANEGDSRIAVKRFIIIHEIGMDNSPALNNAQFMKRNFNKAYVTYIVGDGGKIYQIGEPGYVAWGALNANPYAPVQIELARTNDKATFQKDYVTYIGLIRDSAKKYGIPLTLDAGDTGTPGVKTHNWVTQNFGGDHVDPYGYLKRWGIDYNKLANDIKNGVGAVSKPSKPRPKVKNVNVYYSLHVKNGSWLDEVKNFLHKGDNGYAGIPNHKHDLLTVKVARGSLKARVHTIEDGWLPWTTSKGDKVTAGKKGHTIDGVQFEYWQPKGEPSQQAYYRSQTTQRTGWLEPVKDTHGYAGIYGEPLDRLQLNIDNYDAY